MVESLLADEVELDVSTSASSAAVVPLLAGYIQHRVEECACQFTFHGCCIVRGVLPAARCSHLADVVDAQLQEARRQVAESGQDESTYVGELFGKLRCREQRWAVKLPLEGPVLAAMRCLGRSLGPLLAEVIGPSSLFTELSSIVSDPGARQQPLHSDARDLAEPGMLSVLIALQPITPAMGGTIVCPGTHCPAGSRLLDRVKPQGSDEVRARAPSYQDAAIEALGGVQTSYEAGSALVYDSRLIHCGGANCSGVDVGARRRVLVATFAKAKKAPRGSACTIRRDLMGRFRVRNFLDAKDIDATAEMVGWALAAPELIDEGEDVEAYDWQVLMTPQE